MDKVINWGVLAPGRIAHRFAQAFTTINDGKLYAVASRQLDRATEFARQYGIEKVVHSYEDLVALPDVDAVYIANPHRYHYETIKLCLLAGKSVLCEKPLTVTAQQSIELFALANKNNLFLMEAVWSRFLPCWIQVKHWVDSGKIGEVQLLYSTFGFQPPRDSEDRLFNLDLAGGALLDTGVYNIALTEFILNKQPSKVQSAVLVGETGVDERCTVTMDYGEVTSQFTCSFLSQLENKFQITGSKGAIVVEGNFWDATVARLTTHVGESIVWDQPYRASGFEYQIEEVHRCLKSGRLASDNMSADVTIGNMQVMDEILEKAGVIYPFALRK